MLYRNVKDSRFTTFRINLLDLSLSIYRYRGTRFDARERQKNGNETEKEINARKSGKIGNSTLPKYVERRRKRTRPKLDFHPEPITLIKAENCDRVS